MNRALVERLLGTLRLTRDANAPAIAWRDEEVAGLHALLRYEGAELWFYRSVQQKAIPIPDALRAALRTSVQQQSVINMRIDAQTVAVTSMLSNAAIPWVLLKGQARRAAVRLYPFADARTVSDVDLLLPEAHAKGGWDLLRANGFRLVNEGPVDWSADHHLPTLIDANNVAVELHTTTAMSVSPSEAWRRATTDAQPVDWSGISTTVPAPTELVWQALAHGASDGPEGYTLKAFLSVAAVLAVAPEIAWHTVAARIASREALDNITGLPLDPERPKRFLALAASLAGASLPADLCPSPPASLIPLLQWRARVLSADHGRAWRGRLLEEAARVETLSPLTPAAAGAGVWAGVRRRAGSVVARGMYLRARRA
ncbi:MAG: nucleotidyltransferase family protein [Gemmatimonas sp.]